jgi:hypothetical protein
MPFAPSTMEVTASAPVSAKSVARSPAILKTLPPGLVPTSELPSASAMAEKDAVASVRGMLPVVHPARTAPSELTATPFRSPPENSSRVSRSKVRVPTAEAGPAKRTAVKIEDAKAARRMDINVPPAEL